ncbi:MAG TPA: MMPL family transporter [Dehalococcoidia bacterium]
MSSPASGGGQSFTSRIALWSARNRKLVAGAWALAVIVALAACSTIEADDNVEQKAPGESGKAVDLFDDRFGENEDALQEIVTFSHPTLSVDDPEYEDTVNGLMADLRAVRAENAETWGGTAVTASTRIVSDTTTHYDIGAPREASPFVAENATGGDVTFALVQIEGEIDEAMENIDPLIEAVTEAEEEAEGFEILIGGDASLNKQMNKIVGEDFANASLLNLPITFAILMIAFSAVVAAAVPLILAFSAVALAMAVLTAISQVYALDQSYAQIVLLMGLATGIDYSLFVVSRYRNERNAGRSKDEALQVASGTSGKAIVFAGATTVFAVAGMFLVNDQIFASLGLAAMVVVIFAVLAAMTLLPAMIALMGDNIDRLRIPFLPRAQRFGTEIWSGVVDRVLKRPVIPAVATVVALLALTYPLLTINIGFNGVKSLPEDAEGTRALATLEENFTLGLVQPAIVVIDAGEKQNVFSPEIQASTFELVNLVGEDVVSETNADALYGTIAREPDFNDAGDTGALFVPLNGDSGEQRAIDAVNALRDDLIPAAFEDSSAEALVTGQTAGNIDFRENIYARTPLVLGFVLGLAFLILLLTFRSIVIAVSAILLNLLSVGAAYGLLVLVFQEGWLLEGVLNFEATGIIESWLPLFVFAILFGMSIDYEMFVMSRIKEKYEEGLGTDEAIAEGVKGTAGVITSAAAIMIAVSMIFAFTRLIGLQQFGFALAVAIAVDATIIRAFVLPTTMKLLGKWNWYLPSWLEWLPTLPMSENVPEPPAQQQSG